MVSETYKSINANDYVHRQQWLLNKNKKSPAQPKRRLREEPDHTFEIDLRPPGQKVLKC